MVTHKLPRGTTESDLEAGIAPRANGEASATVTEHRCGGSHHQGGQGSPCQDPTSAATGLWLSLHPTLTNSSALTLPVPLPCQNPVSASD